MAAAMASAATASSFWLTRGLALHCVVMDPAPSVAVSLAAFDDSRLTDGSRFSETIGAT